MRDALMQQRLCSALPVRTTLDIEDDVLAAAGQMVSRLLRTAQNGRVVSNEQIDQLRDEAGL